MPLSTAIVAVAAFVAGWAPVNVALAAPATANAPQYVGAAVCAECHPRQTDQWRGSHHALAMQQASEKSVLGNFENARFVHGGVVSRFFKRDGKYFVTTDGADGRLADFEIKFTFGVYPLQQYLIELPGGRLQALSIAWDARTKRDGGQRWYHLYPGERIKAGDPLHWTARSQNWNYMCAACHSTHLRKNYDLANNSFTTTWSDINVACEACHGPGSAHAAWGNRPASAQAASAGNGLLPRAASAREHRWVFAPNANIAHRVGASSAEDGVDVCFPCHARRRQITEPAEPGRPFLDNYAPTLLEPGAYHPDGQIDGEVYEYGSFTQSKMYRAGVVCSDCHEPHRLTLKATGNALCAQCHKPEAFDVASHHHHPAGSAGSQCIECHMPTKTYMGVDRRRDHGFRIPRPDLAVTGGTPNPCQQCHGDKTAAWAAKAIETWRGKPVTPPASFTALLAARGQRAEAAGLLAALVQDKTEPAIARATALRSLTSPAATATRASIVSGLGDEAALVRAAAVQALQHLDPRAQARLASPLLSDAVRLVRIEAARTLAGLPEALFNRDQWTAKQRATEELIAAELAAAELPESHLNLGDLYARLGRPEDAEKELKQAIRLDPRFIPARVNLADLYRSMRRETEAEALLKEAMRIEPKAAEPYHALGLLKVRQGERREALTLLAKAAALAPAVARYGYVHGVALHDAGAVGQAMSVLEQSHRRFPADQDILVALALFEHQRGRRAIALDYVDRLARLDPDNPQIRALRERIGR